MTEVIPRWRMMELWMDSVWDQGKDMYEDWTDEDRISFTVHQLAELNNVPVEFASSAIQAYLTAQRGARSKTRYILCRVGRTRSATWEFGLRKRHGQARSRTLSEDLQVSLANYRSDMLRLKRLNPRLAPYIDAKIAGAEGAISMLAMAMDGVFAAAEMD